jgi:L-fuconate dehydratase
MTDIISRFDTYDVRFPTSLGGHGSDAMNKDPDYSAAYVVLGTDEGAEGHGFAFTIGRGTEIQVAAIEALRPLVVGISLEEMFSDMGAFSRRLSNDSHLRWLGPDKGVTQMAIGAVVNAAWDLFARREGKPLWRLLSELPPEQLANAVDYRHISDALTRSEAIDLLRRVAQGRAERVDRLLAEGYPAYTTTPGWLGYTDSRLVELCKEAVEAGFGQVKLKVGADLRSDLRRCELARDAIGSKIRLAIDANQSWEVSQAIESIKELARFDLAWVEEPTHPDDIFGHRAISMAVAPIAIAAGEHVPNRIMFKQMLENKAIQICQIDACRVSGVNENLAIMLLAAKFGVRVCPHAGGVGLCEVVQHLAMFDYVAFGGDLESRTVEYVDHLHEHFVDPVRMRSGRYLVPLAPGIGAKMHPESVARYSYPDGAVWRVSAS